MLWWLLLGQLQYEPDNFVRGENRDYILQNFSKEFSPHPFLTSIPTMHMPVSETEREIETERELLLV